MNKYISTFEIGESEYKLKDSEVRTDLGTHEGNTDIHVTAAEKEYWNSKVNPPSYSAPTAKQLTYTGEAQDLLNPGSSTSGSIQYSTDEVNWSTTIPQATNAGTYTVYWKFAGSEIVYVDSTAISVTIAKANPTYTAPTAKTLTYNGNVQDLINAGTTNDGTFKYGFAPGQYIDSIDGHLYVEIGGVKWATMNVGANNITDTGLYFQWGDTQGYTASQVGSGEGQKYFSWADYKYSIGGSSTAAGMSKYNATDGKTVLEASDDAVTANWGDSWRMPTAEEYVALGNAVNTTWTEDYQGSGVAGITFTDKTDSSKVLFFPAAGLCSNGNVYSTNLSGFYWSSLTLSNSVLKPFCLSVANTGSRLYSNIRATGYPVRGVVMSNINPLPQGTNADTYTVYWKLEGDENHNDVSGTVEVTIAKVTPTVVAPTAKSGLEYDSTAQALVTAGSTNYGELQYSLDDTNYSTSVTTGTNAGSYTVYYKVVGNSNVNDVAATSINVSIAKANKDISVTPVTTAASGSAASPTVSGDDAYDSVWTLPESNGIYAAYADGTFRTAENADSNAIGVAVITNNCSFIIDRSNETISRWDSSCSTNGVISGCFATDDTDTAKTDYSGVSNTNAIAAVASGGEVAKRCRDRSKTIGGGVKYGYLGACGEWNTAYANKTDIDSMMSTIGGTVLKSLCYWCSTLRLSDSGRAWQLRWGNGNVDDYLKLDGTRYIRPLYTIGATPLFTITSSNTSVATVSGTTINAVGVGTTTITITSTEDENHNEYTYSYTLTVKNPNGVYAAYADGSMRTAENADTNAIGVAVITDNCKFIIDKTNDTTKTWDGQYKANGVIAGCFATDSSDTAKTNYTGVSNTNAIAAVASGGEAAKYCRSCSKTIAGKTVYGYLGACGEWQTAYDNKTIVDSIMSTIGGTAISSNIYWTSTLVLSDYPSAWRLRWDDGFVGYDNKRLAYGLIRPLYEIS